MYYVPLCPPKNPQDHRADSVMWDPMALPSQQHKDFIHIVSRIQAARTKAEREKIKKETGIKGIPTMSCVRSINFAHSMP